MARTVITPSGTRQVVSKTAAKITAKMAASAVKPAAAAKSAPRPAAAGQPTYAQAWAQLEKALAAGFPLEAMGLAEGILTDQLALYLSGPLVKEPIAKDRGGQWPAFYLLVEKLKTDLRQRKLEAEEGTEAKALSRGLSSWRDNQARIVSALVRANPATSAKAKSDAMEAAAKGAQLASGFCAWHGAQG